MERRRAITKSLKELLDAKGYGELGFSTITFRDHAARLER